MWTPVLSCGHTDATPTTRFPMSNTDTDVSPTLGTVPMERDDIVSACRQWNGSVEINEERTTYEAVAVTFGLAEYSPDIRAKTTELVADTEWNVFHPRDTGEKQHYEQGLVRFERSIDDA